MKAAPALFPVLDPSVKQLIVWSSLGFGLNLDISSLFSIVMTKFFSNLFVLISWSWGFRMSMKFLVWGAVWRGQHCLTIINLARHRKPSPRSESRSMGKQSYMKCVEGRESQSALSMKSLAIAMMCSQFGSICFICGWASDLAFVSAASWQWVGGQWGTHRWSALQVVTL